MTSSSQWVIFNELAETSNVYLRTVTQIEGSWLIELSPEYFDVSSFPEGRMKSELLYLYRKLFS